MDRYKKAGTDNRQPALNTLSSQQLKNSTFIDAALAYAKHGWPVVALHTIQNGHCTCGDPHCARPGKHPCTKLSVKDASLDVHAFISWSWCLPDANLGIATGSKSNLIVVEIDPDRGGIDSLMRIEQEHGAIRTFSMRTGGGGRHDYYRLPSGFKSGCPKSIWPGIDIEAMEGMWWLHPRVTRLAIVMRSSTICRWC